jgi:hypothetical protein
MLTLASDFVTFGQKTDETVEQIRTKGRTLVEFERLPKRIFKVLRGDFSVEQARKEFF